MLQLCRITVVGGYQDEHPVLIPLNIFVSHLDHNLSGPCIFGLSVMIVLFVFIGYVLSPSFWVVVLKGLLSTPFYVKTFLFSYI
jgi:hypothetical protein